MATPLPSATGAYRTLLRATRIAFQGDYRLLFASRIEARKQFDANRTTGVDTPMKIQHALETADILRKNVVQGQKIDEQPGMESVDRYELRIHEDIERGDNETIKKAGKGQMEPGQKCCSS